MPLEKAPLRFTKHKDYIKGGESCAFYFSFLCVAIGFSDKFERIVSGGFDGIYISTLDHDNASHSSFLSLSHSIYSLATDNSNTVVVGTTEKDVGVFDIGAQKKICQLQVCHGAFFYFL